ncbi:uncharacterized protein [Clytia hemisphaerica]
MPDFLSTLTTDITLTTDTLHTSAVDLISSIHGHQRRAERAIEKKDLQSAVLHGTRERQERLKNGITQIRYKYTFADIVYITDVTSTHEITSWVLPLPLDSVRVSDNDQHQYNAAVSRIAQDPKIITSHSVFVIDCSGSMKSADVEAHRCRADAVSYSVASEFIAKRLHNPSFGVTPYNVVTVIEMREDAQIVFKKEPMSWVFYNKFVQRSKTSKPSSHGSYIPSLDLAMQALKENDHEHLALFLFFLSDGRPSDVWLSKHGDSIYPSVSRQDIYRRASAIGSHFQERLNFGMVGFGRPFDDLSVLNEMANQMTIQGAVGSFHRSDLKKINSLSTSLANMSSTLTKTCTLLTNARVGDSRKERSVTISQFQKHIIIPPNDWDSKTVRQNRLVCSELTRHETGFVWTQRHLLEPKAAGISFSNDPFGKGAERLVYQLREIDANGKIIGTPLVAKDGKYVEDYNQLKDFHYSFCKTQKIAANLAVKFNDRLDQSPQVAKTVPRVKFLDCFVYTFYDQYDEYNYLVEKQLDHNQYRKWNDNQGGIQGQKKVESPYPGMVKEVAPLQMLKDLKLKPIMSDIIEEENSEDEEDDASDDEASRRPEPQPTVTTSNVAPKSELDILNEDVPQAFSHFSHKRSRRRRMVCDLQGVLDTSQKPPMFELTDPVIHYKSSRNRENVYGKTDKGQKGINDFFQTHKCNNLCRALGIFSS